MNHLDKTHIASPFDNDFDMSDVPEAVPTLLEKPTAGSGPYRSAPYQGSYRDRLLTMALEAQAEREIQQLRRWDDIARVLEEAARNGQVETVFDTRWFNQHDFAPHLVKQMCRQRGLDVRDGYAVGRGDLVVSWSKSL